MAIKERSWEEIQKDELKYTALNRLVEAANSVILDDYVYGSLEEMGWKGEPIYAGDNFKKRDFAVKKYRGECMQRLIKEMYREYGEQCNSFPEIRFMIYPDSTCVLDVFDGKKIPYF